VSIDMSQADAKDAKLTLKLVAKSGYRAEAKFEAISANQWSRIMAAADGKEQYRVMMAAPAMLDQLEKALDMLETFDGTAATCANIRKVIASARQETRHGE